MRKRPSSRLQDSYGSGPTIQRICSLENAIAGGLWPSLSTPLDGVGAVDANSTAPSTLRLQQLTAAKHAKLRRNGPHHYRPPIKRSLFTAVDGT